MNKKEAIAYAQTTLEIMLSSNYIQELNLQNFGIEMKQVIKLYPRNIILQIANGKLYAERKLEELKNGSDVDVRKN